MVFKGEEKQEEFLTKVRHEEEENRAKILAEKTNFPYLNLAFVPIESDALKIVSKEKSEKANTAIINREGRMLYLAVLNPDSKETKSLITELENLKYTLKVSIVSKSGLKKALAQYPPPEIAREITGRVEISGEDLINFQKEISDIKTLEKVLEKFSAQGGSASGEKAEASQIVEAILVGALILGASDIHFEPEKEAVRVRLRLDGILEDIVRVPLSPYSLVLNRIKLLSGLKLNIHEKAQDGRFSIFNSKTDEAIEIRTSVLPGAYNENIVMRILDPRIIKIDLGDLGIREDDLEIINEELKKPTGMILTTGPTGSGKTTTLYAFIKKILTPDIKIITIEDPIEYHIEGVSQTQVEPKKGYTFENGLRSIVRQDPDIILVGEIRDYETAEIAMNAALTGHLVFSTLHTNDAVGAIPRLIDLGIKPPAIAPAINLLMAQRLLRKVCQSCSKKRTITAKELQNFKKILIDLPIRVKLGKELNENTQISEPQNCKNCHKGYSGRIAVLELFRVDDVMEDLILNKPAEYQIKTAAQKTGFVTMEQDAVIKIINGVTTIEEMERVLGVPVPTLPAR